MIQIILVIIITCVYCEVMWKAVVLGHRPYDYMRKWIRLLAIFNYSLAIAWNSPLSLILAATASLYELVIYQKRYTLISGEGNNNDSTGKT